MADQLGGAASNPTADRASIWRQQEPAATAYEVVNWAYGLQTGQGQAFGSETKGIPGGQFDTRTPTGPGSVTMVQAPSKTVTVNEALSQLHNLPPDKLQQYQNRLYAAGFYPDRAYTKGAVPPNGKIVSNEDVIATINLMSAGQRYTQVNSDGSVRTIKTIDEIINESIAAGLGQQKVDSSTSQQQGRVYGIQTSDPATLRGQVKKVGQAILGRALNEQEEAALVTQVLNMEKGPQQAAITAGRTSDTGTDVTLATAQVDSEARLREMVEAQNPTEATAYAEMNYVNVMRQMIGGE